MSVLHLYSDNFEEVVSAASCPVVVDFWASWCTPCRMIAPIIEDIADELDGRIDVYKVDVDEASDIAASFGVMSIPTIMVFTDGKEQERIVGGRSKEDLMSTIEKYL